MSVEVRVEGVRELRAALRRAGQSLDDFKDTNERVARIVVTEVQRRAPRRTGRLARSARPSKSATRATVSAGGARVPYANAVHWGVGPRPGRRGPHNIRRNPFVWDSIEETEPRWLKEYQAAVEKIADQFNNQ